MIRKNVLLKDYSNYKIGGPADYFLEINSKDELIKELEELKGEDKILILGGGTNILFSEKGFDGLVIHNNILGVKTTLEGVEVGAGVMVSDFLNFCIENSLSGFEWAGGLPGSIGGAVRGNAGAFGGETKDTIVKVKSISLKTSIEVVRNSDECEFNYRSSIFKTKATDEIITSVVFRLFKADKEEIRKNIQEKIEYRNLRHPMDKPSLGSTFKNIPVKNLSEEQKQRLMEFVKNDPFPVIPVAKLLVLCGLKGKAEGDARISEKHPNFIVNMGNAKSTDVKKLIEIAKTEIKNKFGIILEEEIMYV